MKIVLVLALSLALTATSIFAVESPYRIAISELASKAAAQDDSTYMTLAAYRCSALLTLANGIMERDAGIKADGDVGGDLLEMGYILTAMKAQERGAEVDLAGIVQRAGEERDRHHTKYYDWMVTNYDTYGDYWGSDKVMAAEIASCKELAQIAKGVLQ